jgi:hypothetical protein
MAIFIAPGSAGTVQVGTVTTLAPNTNATVVNVGTESAAVFNFGIPAGVAGAAGSTGSRMLDEITAVILRGSIHIGSPGLVPFGVGAVPVVSNGFLALDYSAYNPVHAASGSFM